MKFKVRLLSKYPHVSQLRGALVVLISLAASIGIDWLGQQSATLKGIRAASIPMALDMTPVLVFHYTEPSEEESNL